MNLLGFVRPAAGLHAALLQLDQKRQEFIEKTKDLPPLSLGGNGHGGPVNQPKEVKADGTTH